MLEKLCKAVIGSKVKCAERSQKGHIRVCRTVCAKHLPRQGHLTLQYSTQSRKGKDRKV